jgi:dTDP-4-amino-4,6-dideoxygalactose transaminase
MQLIPHSYPNLTRQDCTNVLDCFDHNFVGFDNEIDKKIKSELRSYLSFQYLEITPSGSIALSLILKSMNLENGDEIILSAINCWSVYNIIKNEGARPVICDVRSCNDFRASYETIIQKITKHTKAVIITHMFGSLLEEKIIQKIKDNYPKLKIIEDFSTSIFSTDNYKLGKYSDYGLGSFGSTKPLTGGIGGVICSHTKIVDTHYDQKMGSVNSFNIKISRINQMLLLSQIENFPMYQKQKKKVIKFYQNYVNIYNSDAYDLFRAITFDDPKLVAEQFKKLQKELDIRRSVQPNLTKELEADINSNAYNFKNYYSLPLHIGVYRILSEHGMI